LVRHLDNPFDFGLIDELINTVKNDSAISLPRKVKETHWVIYGKDVSEDAIGDSVRPSLMIRKKDGNFISNCNISDCDFASSFDSINKFKAELEKRLNM